MYILINKLGILNFYNITVYYISIVTNYIYIYNILYIFTIYCKYINFI